MELLHVLHDRKYRAGISFIDESQIWAVDEDRNGYILDIYTGECIKEFDSALQFGPIERANKGSLVLYKPLMGKGLLDPNYLAFVSEPGLLPIWTFKPELGMMSYSFRGDVLIYQGETDSIYSLHIPTGEIVWKQDYLTLGHLPKQMVARGSAGRSHGNPRIWKNLIITSLSGYVVGLSMETGELVWRYEAGTDPSYNPCVTEDGRVYLASCDVISHENSAFNLWFLAQLDARTGELVNRIDLNPPGSKNHKRVFKRKASLGIHAYGYVTTTHYWFTTDGGLLMAVNLETGNIDWYHDFKDVIYHVPFTIYNNRLYVQSLYSTMIIEGAGGCIPDIE